MIRAGFILLMLFSITACDFAKDNMTDKIRELENDDSTFNLASASQLVELYTDYVETYPKDEKSSEYLFKSGQNQILLKEPEKALQSFKKVTVDYPDSKYAEQSMFLQGYIQENSLGNLEKAKVEYRAFLNKYPQSHLAKDAQFSLDNVGKSAEEIFKQFQKDSLIQ